eukprot:1637628-Pyramimonas_sp.AAC.1
MHGGEVGSYVLEPNDPNQSGRELLGHWPDRTKRTDSFPGQPRAANAVGLPVAEAKARVTCPRAQPR